MKDLIYLGSYDSELIKNLVEKKLDKNVKVINDPQAYLNLIEQKFEFSGSKINWSQTNIHYSKKSGHESLLNDASLFITEIKQKHLNDNNQVIYIGDGLTEFGYQFEINDLETVLSYILDIPQHHYFISLEGNWCLCISFENYLDFGFSLN